MGFNIPADSKVTRNATNFKRKMNKLPSSSDIDNANYLNYKTSDS